jgi:carbonic anhydrase
MLEQSPIDIRSEHSMFTPLPALQFQYSAGVTLNVVNTGSPDEFATVRANVPTGAGALTVAGTTYDLLQFHFHIEAEHLINGHRAEMELHMVHQATNGDFLVVGRLIEFGMPNAALAPIFSSLPPNPGDQVTVSPFDLGALLPSHLASFRYPGSLTTPPFTEGVSWVVLAEPLELSPAQIDAFRQLFPHGNVREVQPLNGRVVLTDVAGFATVPEPATLTLLSLGSLGLLVFGWRRQQRVAIKV